MSEIAKCPCCGKEPEVWCRDEEIRIRIVCCKHAAYSTLGWNQYAAAMDYAKKTAYWFGLPDGIHHPDDARAEKAMTDAETRVLEVFK